MEQHQLLHLVFDRKIKPYVRANKRFAKKGSSDKGQYQEYTASKETLFVAAHEQMMANDWHAIEERTPFWLVGYLSNQALFTYDLDNLTKSRARWPGRESLPQRPLRGRKVRAKDQRPLERGCTRHRPCRVWRLDVVVSWFTPGARTDVAAFERPQW